MTNVYYCRPGDTGKSFSTKSRGAGWLWRLEIADEDVTRNRRAARPPAGGGLGESCAAAHRRAGAVRDVGAPAGDRRVETARGVETAAPDGGGAPARDVLESSADGGRGRPALARRTQRRRRAGSRQVADAAAHGSTQRARRV